nr:retrovirus-related Pol polyprotein from transposon TNT 1-94 [Tanacetum cinerariifolium]
MNNDKVISPGMFRINPFKTFREEKHVPNTVSASNRKKSITVLQPPVFTKKDVNSDLNGLSSTAVDNTKTRRPQPRSNTKHDRVPSTSKSSRSKNKEAEVEEHHRKPRFLLRWVYFVEGLGHNLFSVGQFCDSDLEVAFRRNACFVRNLEGVDLLKGDRSTNLYTINLHEMASASPICLMARASSTKSWLWHQQLSHLNFDTINDLARNDLVSGLLKFKYNKEHLCPSCEQGKRKRASHPPKPVPNSRQRLHLLHMDLCGPMRIASINGKRKPNISFLYVFGALCYPKNDHEDIGKLVAKGLDLTYAPSTITTQQPTEGELYLMFEAMYDDYIGDQPSATARTVPPDQEPQVRQTSTASTTIADTAPTLTNSSSHATNIPITPQDVDKLNSNAMVDERVLKEVKLKIIETEFLKKASLLGDLDLNIIKAYKREITKHLRHHEQMRRWESFMNGRPILPMISAVDMFIVCQMKGCIPLGRARCSRIQLELDLECFWRSTIYFSFTDLVAYRQLKFNSIKDAKKLLEAVEKRFGRNAATKKTQKNLLKQQYENFTAPSSEMLDQTFDRLQKLVSQFELLKEKLSQEDANQKLLRSLSPEWNTHVFVWRNKVDLYIISTDDLYNNLKVYEPEVKGMSSSSSSTHNMAFVSSSNNNTSNTNGTINTAQAVNTTYRLSTASTQVNAAYSINIDNLSDAVIYAFFASQPNSP